jgi:hypothetical protein
MSYMKTSSTGDKHWFNEDREHHRNNDLPAIECSNGDKIWFVNGKHHRDNNLPATEYANGNKFWYVGGKRHRGEGLPAAEYADGDKMWFVDGKLHRDNDLPAIEFVDGTKKWYENGKHHRLCGLPATINNEEQHWHIYDKEYLYEEVINYYKILKGFGRYCLRKIRMRRLRRVRYIHGELLCMPPKGNYLGGQDNHQMVSYFMSMDKN